jgi:hypothetical protein
VTSEEPQDRPPIYTVFYWSGGFAGSYFSEEVAKERAKMVSGAVTSMPVIHDYRPVKGEETT